MRLDVQFPVYRTPPRNFGPNLEDGLFFEAFQFAVTAGLTTHKPNERSGYFGVVTSPGDPALEKLFAILQRGGWKPHYGYVSAGSHQFFSVRVLRRYEPDDFEDAAFLYLESVWGEWPVTGFIGRNGDRWVGDADRVGIHSGLGWTQRIGYVDGAYNYFVGDEVKDAMLRHELVGMRFHALQWNEPAKAKARFWELDSTVQMPPCSLPVVDMDGISFYEENGYSPVELEFNRNDIQDLEPFDIAWCREDIGELTKSNWGRHVLVVSQKFRKVMQDLGLGDLATFYPVRLR